MSPELTRYLIYILILIILIIYFIRSSKSTQSEVAKYLISFIKIKLNESTVTPSYFNILVDLIAQSVLYIISMDYSINLDHVKNSNRAFNYIKTILPPDITLSKIEMETIKTILISVFTLMSSTQMVNKVSTRNYIKIYNISTKYMDKHVYNVGLRKSIR